VERALDWAAFSGHPDASWSVAILAHVDGTLDPTAVHLHVVQALEARPDLGPCPTVRAIEPGTLALALRDAAERRYGAGEPLLRIGVEPGDGGSDVVVAAHHSVLDGLGLLSLLGVALTGSAQSVRSSVRGVDAERAVRGTFFGAGLRRFAQGLVAPSERLASSDAGGETGEGLAWRLLPSPGPGTPALVRAAAVAATEWNRARTGRAGGRVSISVGASRRPGASAGLEDASTYLRLALPSWDRATVERALREAPREPAAPAEGSRILRPIARSFGRMMGARMGPTVLVSSLGHVVGPPTLRGLAFFPTAPGRSGVAIGMASGPDGPTMSLRYPRMSLSDHAGAIFLEAVRGNLQEGAP